jgi:hypothetical protein
MMDKPDSFSESHRPHWFPPPTSPVKFPTSKSANSARICGMHPSNTTLHHVFPPVLQSDDVTRTPIRRSAAGSEQSLLMINELTLVSQKVPV